jgi:hypothetical protein
MKALQSLKMSGTIHATTHKQHRITEASNLKNYPEDVKSKPSFKMAGNTHPVTQNVAEGSVLQQHNCENLKSCFLAYLLHSFE